MIYSTFKQLEIKNPEDAFEDAIKKGMKNPEDWMYMHSTKFKDYFKHCDTRKYISFFNLKNLSRKTI